MLPYNIQGNSLGYWQTFQPSFTKIIISSIKTATTTATLCWHFHLVTGCFVCDHPGRLDKSADTVGGEHSVYDRIHGCNQRTVICSANAQYVADPVLAGAIAAGGSIALMQLLRCLHWGRHSTISGTRRTWNPGNRLSVCPCTGRPEYFKHLCHCNTGEQSNNWKMLPVQMVPFQKNKNRLEE